MLAEASVGDSSITFMRQLDSLAITLWEETDARTKGGLAPCRTVGEISIGLAHDQRMYDYRSAPRFARTRPI